jgi:XTP/dITP diphosphohydrolase
MDRLRILLASQNAHKARELQAALPGASVELVAGVAFPEETGATFYENARAKAELGRAHAPPGLWAAGEDSGLEVEALGGRPGIRSARFAGEGASDEANVDLLLAELADVSGDGRRGRYVCELVVLSPDGAEVRGSGALAGRIAHTPRGSGGFGYDPVFVPDGEAETVAELGDEWKAKHSHRARAALALALALGRGAEPL